MELSEEFDSNREMALAALFGQIASSSITFRQFAPDGKLLKRLARLEPLGAARTFANLLLQPSLQGNGYRAEVLAQLALACGKGQAKVDAAALRYLYNAMNEGWAGRLEDPPEDVFVYQVRCRAGNFRILEGMWEGNGFYLQIFLDFLEMMPKSKNFDQIRTNVLAMVRLSDALCNRAGLARWTMGAPNSLDTITAQQAARLLSGRNRLRFTAEDLMDAGIDLLALRPFLFTSAEADLLDCPPAGSPFESKPLIFDGTALHVVLPTAFSAAIRSFVIRTLLESGNAAALKTGIANAYAKLWWETPLLGAGSHRDISFEEELGIYWGELNVQIDTGRNLHLLFIVDPLDDFDQGGLSGGWSLIAHREVLDRRIADAWRAAQRRDYRGGLTLVVSCGVGRGAAVALGKRETPGWQTEFLSAYELNTLSWLPDFEALTLWRLLGQRDEAARLGLEMMNINGLINLVAWSRQLSGHIVPHAHFEDDQATGLLGIDQTALREVRHEVAIATDPQVAHDVQGRLLRIRRDYDDTFAEDTEKPIYGSEDPGPSGKPMSAFLGPHRVWWADTVVPNGVPVRVAYERWKTVRLWLARTAAVLEEKVKLPKGPILWAAIFEEPNREISLPDKRIDFVEARSEIEVSVEGPIIITKASRQFELAWLNEENVAERALVAALVEGVGQMTDHGISPGQADELIEQIVDNPLAKQQHGFVARGFRDWVRDTIAQKPVMLTREDDAAMRLGLGWKVRDRSLGAWIEGREDCNTFLAALVRQMEDELFANLCQFERTALIEALLLNHERAAFDRDLWDRTAASNLALRADRVAALKTMRMHKFRLNATSLATRLLIEAAVCACPVGEGSEAGKLDLSNLLARMMLIFEIGGWSDAIRWGVMAPKLRVTPLGDVHGNFDWHDQIVEPFGEKTGNEKIAEAEKGYAENLQELPIKPTVDLDLDFDAAWSEEFGASFQQTRVFIEHLENEGQRRGEPILKLSRNELRHFTMGDEVVDGPVAERLVDSLLLLPREDWRVPPAGFLQKDVFPWRFRRRLSLLRRPLVKVDADTILVAPGMLREAFLYMLGNYWLGDFPKEQLSPRMSAWQDKVVGERGRKLAAEVATKLENAGWTVWTEKKLPELLNKKLDRNYGDVDVLARKGSRVLAIECKDLMYRKTHGEITEQVRDYQGQIRNGKRDELRKHLDRMEVLRSDLTALGRYVGVPGLSSVESHLVFRNPVPVIYALQQSMHDVQTHVLSEMSSI